MYLLLLVILIAVIIYSALTGGDSYKVLEKTASTQKRQSIYRSWIRESWLLFGIPSFIGIVLLLESGHSLQLPFTIPFLERAGFGASIGIIMMLVFVIAYSWRQSTTISPADRDKTKQLISKSGSGALIAKNREERKLARLLSFAAGLNEELFFRVILPGVMVVIFGIEWLVPVVVLSALLFGAAHAYQGISGIIATAIIGGLLMFIYLSTGSILLIILIHILMDIRATVGLSWVAYGRGK